MENPQKPPHTKQTTSTYGTCNVIPARVVLTILGFFGYINLYAMRVNLSVAMVAMVGVAKPDIKSNQTVLTCPELIIPKNITTDNETIVEGEFKWDSNVQAQILGSFFYGYLVTQIPGGILAEKYSAKWIYGLGVLFTSLFTLLTPIAARWSVWALFAVRAGEGLAGGVAFPAMNVLIGRWVPKLERSRISTTMNSGLLFGTVITNSITGILCESTIFGGWPSVFYLCGMIGCIWFIFWTALVYEYPENHPRITKAELNHIQNGRDNTKKDLNTKIPWKSIWTSLPVWSAIIAHFGQNWAFYTLLTMMPTYLSNVLHLDLKNNGLVSGLPYLLMALFSFVSCIVADALRSSGRLRITTIRKLFNSIAFFSPAVCTTAIAFAGCHPVIIIVLFSLSFAFNGSIYSSYMVNHVDMSPRYAGTLMGITNCIATLPGFLAPLYVGALLKSGQTLWNWGIVYLTGAGIHLFSGIFYNIFASAELQPWNDGIKKKPNIKLNTIL